jgi:diacylglycerol kinase family enzyme
VPEPLVLLNPACNYGTGLKRWQRVEPELRHRIGSFALEQTSSTDDLKTKVAAALGRGVTQFIAAGGDGTVNALANVLLAGDIRRGHDPISSARMGHVPMLGAVGLGSSNDFHKPFRPEDRIGRVPLRVDFDRARPVDVIQVDYGLDEEAPVTRYCLLNASIGVTAEANAFFNSRSTFIRALQRVSVNLAIFVTALRGVLAYRNIPCRVRIDDQPDDELAVTNLSVLKRPNVAGSLCYDSPVAPDDGRLAANLCWGLSLPERVSMLAALTRGHFTGRPKTRTQYGTSVQVQSEQAFAVEMDGEVVTAKAVTFRLVPKALRVCM